MKALVRTTLAALGLAIALPVHAARFYSVTDLGTLLAPGVFGNSSGTDINAKGQIVGSASFDEGGDVRSHAFLYSGGAMQNLGILTDRSSTAMSINDKGWVAGYSSSFGGGDLGFLWTPGTGMLQLPSFGGDRGTLALSINDNGWITGSSFIPGDSERHAFVFDGLSFRDLASTIGTGSAVGNAINDSGWVAGTLGSQAFLSSGLLTVHLGTLGGFSSFAADLNESNEVTGQSRVAPASDANHAFLYTGGTMHDLGTLGDRRVRGVGINDLGQVTGWSTFANDTSGPGVLTHAFLYADGTMLDLNSAIDPALAGLVTLTRGQSLNDAGFIVANGVDLVTHETHAYLLSPSSAVPLPAAGWLLVSGLVGFGAATRRRRATA